MWHEITDDSQELRTVNRMRLYREKLYICTNEGLMSYSQGEWEMEELEIPCFQLRIAGRCAYAGTAYGLWSCCSGSWKMVGYPERRVYDFLNVPQYLILAHDKGIAVYDRLTDSWADFNLGTGVTSLAVYRGHLIGATENGGLVVGNKKGGFDRVHYRRTIVFNVMNKGENVFLCTDKGLYRYGYLLGQATMYSVRLGGPVADADLQNGSLYIATIFEGIKTLPVDEIL
ncbi:hypothetical protein [Paenibacillus beijingensis]|uniref:Uncharacterized protein n=1 Tax=Paenibacillus beijingensis TaxID=1126833 RepID=A0A0D5NH46_9BACL|nr:hypothetical protein [Paenibacillus beijingensis]AJY74460.1 hypothetical protein VN24_07585 [Paenibacillus beijingensis]